MPESQPSLTDILHTSVMNGDVITAQQNFESVLRNGTESLPGIISEEKRLALVDALDQSSEDISTLYESRPEVLKDSEPASRTEVYSQGQQFDEALTDFMGVFDQKICKSVEPAGDQSFPCVKKAVSDSTKAIKVLKRVIGAEQVLDVATLEELGWYTRNAVLEMLQEARQVGRDFALNNKDATDNELVDNLEVWRDEVGDCFVYAGKSIDQALQEIDK